MPRTRRGQTRGEWEKLKTLVTPEVTKDFPYLEDARAKLAATAEEVDRLIQERDFHEARKQETTRKIQDALVEGRKAANLLRVVLRQHFGNTNEQLVAFGIQPFRRRKSSRKMQPPSEAPDRGDETPEPSGAAST